MIERSTEVFLFLLNPHLKIYLLNQNRKVTKPILFLQI